MSIHRTGPIDAGDTVRHVPTGKLWTVAGVADGLVMWSGFANGAARENELEMVVQATEDERAEYLGDLCKRPGKIGEHARRRLMEAYEAELAKALDDFGR